MGKGKLVFFVLLLSLAAAFFVRPAVSGGAVTSWFGPRVMNGRIFHTGTDYGLPTGNPVMPIFSGSVDKTDVDDRKGNYVEITHFPGIKSVYMHLASISAVQGQKIQRPALVGTVGNTGISTGPHLHLEIRLFGIPLPAGLLSLPGRLAEKVGAYKFLEAANIP